MTTEEKRLLLREAMVLGVPKRRLDIRNRGYSALKLSRGGLNTPKKIDEMYENLLLFRNNGGKESRVVEVSAQEQKIKELIEAVKSGVPKNKIDLKSNGGSHSSSPLLEELSFKVKAQELEIAALKRRLESVEKTIQQNQAQNKDQKKKQGKKVLGVAVTQKTDVVGGRKYVRWYGYLKQNGKRRWIYIGKDVSLAEAKIKAFLEKEA